MHIFYSHSVVTVDVILLSLDIFFYFVLLWLLSFLLIFQKEYIEAWTFQATKSFLAVRR